MLNVLLDNRGRVISRRELARRAGLANLSERRCDSLLVSIRRALGPELGGHGAQPGLDVERFGDRRRIRSGQRPTVIAATEAVDLARLLLDLMIVLAAAKIGAEVSERLHIPAVVGEIVAGVLIGPSVLDAVGLDGARGVSIAMIGEIGVLLLLLQVGMEMDLGELGKVGKASLLVAVVGVAVPFAGGALGGNRPRPRRRRRRCSSAPR